MSHWPAEFEELLLRYLSLKDGETVVPHEPLSNYGCDSLALVGLMVELEVAFDFAFPEELVSPETFKTADSLWTAVSDCIAADPFQRI